MPGLKEPSQTAAVKSMDFPIYYHTPLTINGKKNPSTQQSLPQILKTSIFVLAQPDYQVFINNKGNSSFKTTIIASFNTAEHVIIYTVSNFRLKILKPIKKSIIV